MLQVLLGIPQDRLRNVNAQRSIVIASDKLPFDAKNVTFDMSSAGGLTVLDTLNCIETLLI